MHVVYGQLHASTCSTASTSIVIDVISAYGISFEWHGAEETVLYVQSRAVEGFLIIHVLKVTQASVRCLSMAHVHNR